MKSKSIKNNKNQEGGLLANGSRLSILSLSLSLSRSFILFLSLVLFFCRFCYCHSFNLSTLSLSTSFVICFFFCPSFFSFLGRASRGHFRSRCWRCRLPGCCRYCCCCCCCRGCRAWLPPPPPPAAPQPRPPACRGQG